LGICRFGDLLICRFRTDPQTSKSPNGDRLRPHAIYIKGVEPRAGESFRGHVERALDLSRESVHW
jgi:hypothetical protein